MVTFVVYQGKWSHHWRYTKGINSPMIQLGFHQSRLRTTPALVRMTGSQRNADCNPRGTSPNGLGLSMRTPVIPYVFSIV